MSVPCAHAHDHPARLDQTSLALSLSEAEVRCQRAGQRLTPPRRRVLELLLGTDGPVKAYDLIARFGPDGAAAKPPTVYRALEFLEAYGLAHRVESLNAYMACRQGDLKHAAAFLICDCCGSAAELEPGGLEDLQAVGASQGFVMREVVIEARGVCARCR